MRPKEILGMVEEAAGTRMFEERKDKAKRRWARKRSASMRLRRYSRKK